MASSEPPEDEVKPAEEAPPPRPVHPTPPRASDAVGRASNLFNSLDKCLRATRLYEGRGSLVDRLVSELLANATHAVGDTEITVAVTPVGVLFADEDITPEKSRLTDILFRMFRDGVRELTFSAGIDEPEIRALIDVLSTDSKDDEEDFTTLLWRRNLSHIQFYATDTLQTGFEAAADDGGLLADTERARVQSNASAAAEEVVLSPDDLRMLKAEEGLQWVAGCTGPMTVGAISQALFDRVREAFQTPWDEGRFLQMAVRAAEEHPDEPSPLVLDMFDSLLAGGDIEGVARLLKAATESTKFGGAAAKSLQAKLFSTERIGSLARIYDRHVETLFEPVQAGAAAYPEALVALLNGLMPGEARDGLRDALKDAGVDLTSFYAESLDNENEAIVLDAVASLRAIGTEAALHSLTGALGFTSVQVRRNALEGLVGHYPEEARTEIARALGDPDRDNRLLALRILAESGDRRMAGKIMVRVQEATFSTRDAEERAALVTALAAFRDPRTAPYFAGVLAEVNLRRSAESQDRQLVAVEALSGMDAGPAREALEKCAKRWTAPKAVRSAAKAALARQAGEA